MIFEHTIDFCFTIFGHILACLGEAKELAENVSGNYLKGINFSGKKILQISRIFGHIGENKFLSSQYRKFSPAHE